jgi:hypothetical protein
VTYSWRMSFRIMNPLGKSYGTPRGRAKRSCRYSTDTASLTSSVHEYIFENGMPTQEVD